jgi:hypothetical protein
MRKLGLGLLLCIALRMAFAQSSPDPELLAAIDRIKAVDNHTHVAKVVGPGEKDDDYDALPCYLLQPSPDPAMGRADNPLFLAAWQKLYGYKYSDGSAEHLGELLAGKERIKREQGGRYPAWVLDNLGTEYMVANRVAMGRGLQRPRFLWVPYDDALLFPLNNRSMIDTPDRKAFYPREEKIEKRYLDESNVPALPPTLEEYLERVVFPTLKRQQAAGAIAIKFEAAYLRALDFAEPDEALAQTTFSRYAKGGVSPKPEYENLQNSLMRAIARQAGQLGLAVHFHTGNGCGGYFDVGGSNPALLESILNDKTLRQTNFVLLHGGAGPYPKVASALMGKPNVYADFSEQDGVLSARALAVVLRDWLEWYPEKILFGTDLSPGGPPQMDWEESGYVAAANARKALALALTGMMNDGEIARGRAIELARMVLRENAIKLYGLKP